MKKVLLIAASLVLVFAFVAMAQDAAPAGKMYYGLKAGLGMANATGSDADAPTGADKKAKIGFGGGGVLGFELSPTFKAQIEALYLQKGVKYEATSGSEKITEKADYLEFPVTFHFVPAMNGNVKPRFFAGPFLGILMSAKEKAEGFADAADNYDEDVKDFMKSTEFGLTFGAGVNINALTFDLRYDLGLSKIMKEAVVDAVTYQPNVKSTGIYAMIGWSLGK